MTRLFNTRRGLVARLFLCSTLLLSLIFGGGKAKAQTTLTAGDVAIVGYESNGTPDFIQILFLRNVAANTKFFLNDNEVATAGTSTFTDYNESSFDFTALQAIPAGTTLRLGWATAQNVTTAQYAYSLITGGTPGIGNGDDGIYIYQTTTNVHNTGTNNFIYGLRLGATATNTGLRPAGLTDGTTYLSTTGSNRYYNTTGAVYTGGKNALLLHTGNITLNWTAGIPPSVSSYTFTGPFHKKESIKSWCTFVLQT